MDSQNDVQQDRIPVESNRKLYYRIKAEAMRRHIPTRQYLEEPLDEMVPESTDVEQAIPDEDPDLLQPHSLTPEFFAKVLEIHEQIRQSTNGRIFEDSTELIRQMREERSEELDRYLKGV